MRRAQAHGMSNGNVDDWMKVVKARYDFFKMTLRKENEAEKLGFNKADFDRSQLR